LIKRLFVLRQLHAAARKAEQLSRSLALQQDQHAASLQGEQLLSVMLEYNTGFFV
jgi:hypothetical protein